MNTLAERVKLARKFSKLTQEKISELTGISQPAYQKIESGKTKRTTYINELSNVLGVNPHWLATGQGEMTEIQFNNTQLDNAKIDNTLLNQAIAITNMDKDKTIETALKFFITMHAQESLRALRGKLTWEGDLTQMRSATE